MAAKLKVYSWPFYPGGGNRSRRRIVAAKSAAEVARIVNAKHSRRIFNLTETFNAVEIAVATKKPGVVFEVEDPFNKAPETRQYKRLKGPFHGV